MQATPLPAPSLPLGVLGRIGLCVLAAYLVIYESPLTADPRWQAAVVQASTRFLHVTPTEMPNGSGDTIYNYVELVWLALVALVLGLGLAWRGPRLAVVHEGLRLVLRFKLIATMASYGWSKVFVQQFPFPSNAKLTTTYGDSSPMGLLWAFMGYSPAYTMFAGGAEVLGALLLLSRRTTTLGALVLIGVMSNVVMLNFCYDVPVKILSTHLLVMAGILVLPDARRLVDLLVLNRPTRPADLASPVWQRMPRKLHLVAKAVVGLWLVFPGQLTQPPRPTQAYEGVYDVVGAPWKLLMIERRGSYGSLILPNGTRQQFQFTVEPGKLVLSADGADPVPFKLSQPEAGQLRLEGTWEGKPVVVNLTRWTTARVPLADRGFHWINEIPYHH